MNTVDPPTFREATVQARASGALAVSLAVAIALNAVVLTVAAVQVQAWHAPTSPAHAVAWVTAVAAPAKAPESVEAPRFARSNLPPLEPAPVPRRGDADTVAATPKSPPSTSDDDRVVRFYKYREVDRIAEPESGWNLDAAVLDSSGIQTLAFEIFIDASGGVVACTILAPADLPDGMRSLLEKRLRETVMEPAQRNGVRVASVRRIEVSVQSDGQ